MSLAALEQVGVTLGAGSTTARHSTSNTALAFAFDKAYLVPFKVMLFSLARAATMLESPIYVYSDDPSLFDDEIVRLVTDHPVLIEGELRDELYDLAEHHIGRPERADWNRGTCLKWAIFDDYPVEQVLFLDVDMLCLGPIEDLLVMSPRADLIACPQFQRSMLFDDAKQPASMSLGVQRLNGMVDETQRRFMGRLNSGVLLARKPLLSGEFREVLLESARTRVEVNEQSQLTAFFAEPANRDRYRLRLVSSAYNFHESYLRMVDGVAAFELLRRIKILHYPGSPKPWNDSITKDSRLSTALWWAFFRAAAEHSEILDANSISAPP
jgi:lipopolysaccharide biosynthesis glycosyltransferase